MVEQLSENQIKLKKLSFNQWITMITISFFILLAHQFIDQSLNLQLMSVMQKESSNFAFIAAGVFLNGLIIIWLLPIFYISLVQKQHPETTNIPIISKINDYSKEWLRGIGEASLWMFVFIIPGLFRWVEYSLLPFVCFFDQSYQSGNVDALKQCRNLIRGNRIKLWSIWLGLGFIAPLIITSFCSDYESLRDHPFLASLIVFLESLIQTFGFWLLWRLYLSVKEISK